VILVGVRQNNPSLANGLQSLFAIFLEHSRQQLP